MSRKTALSAPSLSVVIPVYNSEGILPELLERLEPVLAEHASAYEVILVDDGSRDASWATIRDLSQKRSWLRGIRLMRNYGQHNAVLCAVRQARHRVIVSMDDDLQHPPEEIPKLLAKLGEGYDVVYGTPERERHGFGRDLGSWMTKLALRGVMGAETARKVSAFRAFDARLRDAFAGYESPFVSLDVLLTWASSRFAGVPVRHDPRQSGVSNYTFRKLATHALNMMTGFSIRPLQLASLLGFSFTAFGLGVLVYVVGRTLIQGAVVPGFAFLASALAIFSGVQLFALGILGEYLARVHLRTMGRPTYSVRSTTEDGAP